MATRKRGSGSRGYERTDRLGELMREIIAEALKEIDDERLEMVTVTAVDVDRELDRAKVYYTVITLGDEDPAPEIAEALEEHRSRVRRAIGAEARVRRVPEVIFLADNTQSSAMRIEQILQGLSDQPSVEETEAALAAAQGDSDASADDAPADDASADEARAQNEDDGSQA